MEIGVGPDEGCNDDCDIEEENKDNRTHQHDGLMFEEALMSDIKLMLDFKASLQHQAQFCDEACI